MSHRILFVNHTATLGGAELCLLDVAASRARDSAVLLLADGPFRERLEAEAVRVRVVSSDALDTVRKNSAWPSPRALSAVARSAWRVARLARGYDVIYANSQKAFVVAGVAGVLARRPVVWHLHDILDRSHFSATNIRIAVTFANLLATRVIANSRATAAAFCAAGGRAEKVRVVYNAIAPAPPDGAGGPDAAAARDAWLAELGLDPSRPVVGVFGRIAHWKGQHVVLDAVASLPDTQALFAGSAMFGDDAAYERTLRAQASRLGLDARVRFLGFRTDVARLMGWVDVVVHASVAAEPFGRVLAEAMLAGRPVVATRAGGATEIVRDGETGLLVTPGAADELAAAIVRLTTDHALARQFADAGRRHAAAEFNPAAVFQRTDDVIAEAVGATPSRS